MNGLKRRMILDDEDEDKEDEEDEAYKEDKEDKTSALLLFSAMPFWVVG